MKPELHINDVRIADAALELGVSQATVRNWVKAGVLEASARGCVARESIDSFIKNRTGSSKLTSRANKSRKAEHNHAGISAAIAEKLADGGFYESIGDEYEEALDESYRNKEGIYYTDKEIVADMMRDIVPGEQTTFLDPCCGSGNFIMEAIERGVRVENIYGFDTDETAVKIARERVRAKTGREAINILCADFLTIAKSIDCTFDLIFTNPPWGKKMPKAEKDSLGKKYGSRESNDTCSLFLFASMGVLAKGGRLGFLLPEAILNIATFESLRKLILENSIIEIKDYGKPFSSVQTKAYSAIVDKRKPSPDRQVACIEGASYGRLQASFARNPKHIFNIWADTEEQAVVEKLLRIPHCTLAGRAEWGLGIVTGDNKNKCKTAPGPGLVPVYRGKDISADGFASPALYIDIDLSSCQQVAPLSIYYAEEKLVYRFISSQLVFYCDNEQNLVLNSANMLVLHPDMPVTSRQLASLFNSRIMNWLFAKLFNTHKILRGDLEMLPVYTSWYHGDTFDETAFLRQNQITYINGSYRLIQQNLE